MYTVSDRFLDAIRNPHTVLTSAEHANLVTAATTPLPVLDGTVTDDSTSRVRRSLTMSLPPEQATWDALDTVGGEITVKQGMRYVDGTREWVPHGVFVVDVDDIGYAPGDTLEIQNAPDRWGKVQKVKLPPTGRASVASNTAWQEIKRLIEGAWGGAYAFPGWSSLCPDTTAKVGALLWDDGDREAAVVQMLTDNSLEAFFDRDGMGVLRPVPTLTDTSPSVWTVDAGTRGVMIEASRSRDRTSFRNAWIVSTSAADVTFVPVEVANTTPGDPLSTTGPLGYMAQEYSSSTIRTSAQAHTVGLTKLSKSLGNNQQLTLESVGNFALDSEDVITAVLPRIDRNTSRPVELHILDTVSHPLAPAGTQSIATRSTRPLTDGT